MKIPERPPTFDEILDEEATDSEALRRIIETSQPVDDKGKYLHWDDMANRTPPAGLTRKEWWLGTSLARRATSRLLPFTSVDGQQFRFSNIDLIQETVHRIDQQASGRILTDEMTSELRSGQQHLVRSLIEEAIASSQMEGADSDRREAEEMLTTGRKPRDRSEMMIAKNYAALQFVLKRSAEELSPEMILELHRVLTEGTFDDPEASGRFQTPDDERAVVYWKDGTLFHQPPPAEELPLRIRELCDFANNVNQQGFIHPIVKAIIIHFFIRYDHPFEGGNGRVSRALFYWSMLHDHYWLMKYLSISSILIQNSSKDPRSYLYSRTDDHDITYFIIFQLGVIERAIQSLYEQFAQESAESGAIERLVHGSARLNPRQIAALQSALQDGSESFTIAGQAGRHGVTQETARSDLMGLAALGLFTKGKVKNRFVFRPADGLAGRLRDLRST